MIKRLISKIYQANKFVSLILTNENKDLLVSQRSNIKKPMNGYYQCPGGHIEPNETTHDALKRELFEETGIEFDSEQMTLEFVFKYTKQGFNYLPTKPYVFTKRTVYVYKLKTYSKDIEQNLVQDTEKENFTQWIWKTINDLQKERCITSLEKYIQNEL